MEMRIFGRTGLKLSVLGFGCRAVGGLMVRGDPMDQERTRKFSVQQVLGEVVPAFQRLRQPGKIRFLGLTAIGYTTALYRVIDAGAFDSAQVVYNMQLLSPRFRTAHSSWRSPRAILS